MASKLLNFVSALALATLCAAAVDQQTFDNMVYSAHFSADAYPMPNCSYPEGTTRLQVYTTGAKGFLAVDGQRKWIIVRYIHPLCQADAVLTRYLALLPRDL